MATTTTTPNMGIVKPNPIGTVEPQVGPTYAQNNDAALDTIDAHDHASGNGVLVPVAGLNIDADLALTGFDLTDVDAVVMDGQATIDLAKIRSVQFDSTSDGDVHVVDGQGRDIQLTSTGSLNATLVGGITGDYSTSTADLEYDDTAKAYELKQDETPDHWANAKVGEVHVHEPLSGIVNAAKIKSPTSLAATSTLTLGTVDTTLPTSLPAVGVVQQLTIDENGAVAADDAHGTRKMVILAANGSPENGSTAFTNDENGLRITTVGHRWTVPIQLPLGTEILSVKCKMGGSVGDTAGFELWELDSGISTQRGTQQTVSSSGYLFGTITLGSPHRYGVASPTDDFNVEILMGLLEFVSGAGGGPFFEHLIVEYRKPR